MDGCAGAERERVVVRRKEDSDFSYVEISSQKRLNLRCHVRVVIDVEQEAVHLQRVATGFGGGAVEALASCIIPKCFDPTEKDHLALYSGDPRGGNLIIQKLLIGIF